MGIKLITITMSFLCFGCSTSKQTKTNTVNKDKDYYIQSFKIAVIYGCIDESTSKNFQKFITENKDAGLFTIADFISHDRVKEAKLLGELFSKQIKPIEYADAMYKKTFFESCISYGFSKYIDSIANVRYLQSKVVE